MTENKKQDKLYEYAALVQRAKLDGKAKALLWHYAYTYNWTTKCPSFYSQRTLCAEVGMSQGTYYQKRQYLVDLGWVKIRKRGFDKPCLVTPLEGMDDPDYEKRSWAKWHPSNKKQFTNWDDDDGQNEEINDPLTE
jgi:hypothetical protein